MTKSRRNGAIENLQREDLNPMDRAEAFHGLIETFGLSHEDVANRVGLDRSTVTNHLRLLKLDQPVRSFVAEGHLSMGHARALAGLEDGQIQVHLANRMIAEGWSVRKLEAEIKQLSKPSTTASKSANHSTKSSYLHDLELQIADQLGTKVVVKPARKKGTGSLTIDFYSLDHFDELIGRLGVSTDSLT